MTLGLCFWIIMLVLIVFTGVGLIGPVGYSHYALYGSGFVSLVLFFLLGWKVFGPPLHA